MASTKAENETTCSKNPRVKLLLVPQKLLNFWIQCSAFGIKSTISRNFILWLSE